MRPVCAAQRKQQLDSIGGSSRRATFWTSQDGSAWTVTETTGVPGYLVGIIWFDGRYIAYGADGPWYRTDRSRMPQVWSSSDLADWEKADIDLSPLPDNAFIWLFPEEEASFGLGSTVVTTVTDGTLRLEVPVALAGAGPDENIADIDELNQWAETNDRVTITEDILDSLGIDFPLDDEELQKLTNYFHSDEANGRLVLETEDGTTWTSRYQSD